MATVPPAPPPSDDEVERRLAALKAGADPTSFGPPPATPRPVAGAEDRAAPGGAEGAPGGQAPADGGTGPALVGEVIDGEGRAWASRGAPPGGGTGAGGTGGGGAGTGTRIVSWSLGQADAGRLGLWFGAGLVAFGAYLVLAEVIPGVAVLGSIALAVVGVALLVLRARDRAGTWALHLGAILAGFGGLRLAADLAGLPSAGWGTLGAGIGLLAVAAGRALRGGGLGWPAWIGGALAIWGGWGALGTVIPGFPTLGDLVVPLVLVAIGVVVVRRGLGRRG